jgi:hypothetical protein
LAALGGVLGLRRRYKRVLGCGSGARKLPDCTQDFASVAENYANLL